VRITTPTWARVEAGATYDDTGVCISGTRIPTRLIVKANVPATPAPSATPTASTTPNATPGVPAADEQLRATLSTDSIWPSGACLTLAVTNPTAEPVQTWSASFTLAPGTSITQSWSGDLTVTGSRARVSAPSWGGSISPGETVRHFGFCISGTALPHDLTAS